MEESSVSAQAQGIDTGGRKTAHEVSMLQENSLNIASLFLQMIESAMQHKYFLRLYNVLQYYSQPAEAQDGSTRFKFLVMEDRKLTNGKVGKKLIQIAPSLDGETEDQVTEKLKSAANSEMGMSPEADYNPATATVEPMLITQDYLLNKDVELVKVVPNSSIKESATQKKNDIAFSNDNDPLIDVNRITEAFNKPLDIKKARICE